MNNVAIIRRKTLSLASKRSISAYYFSIPFIIGFVLFFLSPLIQYVIFSFSTVGPGNGGLKVTYVGFSNYYQVLFVERDFLNSITSSLLTMLMQFPCILLLSFFLATLLGQKFKGRSIARAIFFLPVIIASGAIAISQNDAMTTNSLATIAGMNDPNSHNTVNLTKNVIELFGASFSPAFFKIITDVVRQIYSIVIASGVQILIFLAGLQTISPSLYEASNIEGATSWENFWKITLPMISPMILVNSVYTVVDLMGGTANPVINQLYTMAIKSQQFGYSSAMGVMYFSIILIALGIIVFCISKYVFYENK